MKALRSYWFVGILLATLCSCRGLDAEELISGFDSANKLYEEGKFADAAAAYDKLLASGNVSEALYFNRGNAFFKQGQLGRAIASYLQAEQLSPRDTALKANLQLARSRARGGVPYQPEHWRALFGKLTLNEWTMLFVMVFWLFFLLLALTQWKRALKPVLRGSIMLSGAALPLFGVCFVVALEMDYFNSSVVVIAGEAEVRNGPLDEAPSNFKVRDGAELSVLDHKDGWLEVSDSVQRSGWVRRDQILIVGPASLAKAARSN
jgi:tetratricopeptide (TPR) repeat protein